MKKKKVMPTEDDLNEAIEVIAVNTEAELTVVEDHMVAEKEEMTKKMSNTKLDLEAAEAEEAEESLIQLTERVKISKEEAIVEITTAETEVVAIEFAPDGKRLRFPATPRKDSVLTKLILWMSRLKNTKIN